MFATEDNECENALGPGEVVGVTGGRVESFGKWLKRELWRREWSQAELARRGGFTPSMVSFWAKDQRVPSPESCDMIADLFGLTVDEVLTRAGHRPADVDALDPATRAVVGIMHRLSDEEKQEVEQFARWRLDRQHQRARLTATPPPD